MINENETNAKLELILLQSIGLASGYRVSSLILMLLMVLEKENESKTQTSEQEKRHLERLWSLWLATEDVFSCQKDRQRIVEMTLDLVLKSWKLNESTIQRQTLSLFFLLLKSEKHKTFVDRWTLSHFQDLQNISSLSFSSSSSSSFLVSRLVSSLLSSSISHLAESPIRCAESLPKIINIQTNLLTEAALILSQPKTITQNQRLNVLFRLIKDISSASNNLFDLTVDIILDLLLDSELSNIFRSSPLSFSSSSSSSLMFSSSLQQIRKNSTFHPTVERWIHSSHPDPRKKTTIETEISINDNITNQNLKLGLDSLNTLLMLQSSHSSSSSSSSSSHSSSSVVREEEREEETESEKEERVLKNGRFFIAIIRPTTKREMRSIASMARHRIENFIVQHNVSSSESIETVSLTRRALSERDMMCRRFCVSNPIFLQILSLVVSDPQSFQDGVGETIRSLMSSMIIEWRKYKTQNASISRDLLFLTRSLFDLLECSSFLPPVFQWAKNALSLIKSEDVAQILTALYRLTKIRLSSPSHSVLPDATEFATSETAVIQSLDRNIVSISSLYGLSPPSLSL